RGGKDPVPRGVFSTCSTRRFSTIRAHQSLTAGSDRSPARGTRGSSNWPLRCTSKTMNRRQFLMAGPGGIALAQTNGGRQGVALGFLLVSAAGATNVAPDGKQLWQHPWRGFPIVQPAVTSDGDVLIAAAADSGTRRIRIAHGAKGWRVEKRWGSDALKPYFHDFVVH